MLFPCNEVLNRLFVESRQVIPIDPPGLDPALSVPMHSYPNNVTEVVGVNDECVDPGRPVGLGQVHSEFGRFQCISGTVTCVEDESSPGRPRHRPETGLKLASWLLTSGLR